MINSFTGKYRFLSNFWNAPFTDNNGVRWRSSEQFYQAHKAMTEEDVLKVYETKTPHEAKRVGNEIQENPDFEEGKNHIMWVALQYKFVQNPDIRNKLIDTGEQTLLEGNTWHDNYWGNCSCPKCCDIEGRNELGKQLMMLRDLLKSGAYEVDDVTRVH